MYISYQVYLKENFKRIKKQKEKSLENFNNFNQFIAKTFKIILKN